MGMEASRTGHGRPPRKRGPYLHSADNGQVVITAGDRPERPPGLVTSTDPFDRAHLSMDGNNLLRPAAHDMDGLLDEPVVDTSFVSRPRRYPEACCVAVADGHGVPHDSMFDAWAESARRLTAAGVEVGLGRRKPGDDGPVEAIRLADLLGREKLRALLRPRLRTGPCRSPRDRAERELSAAASAILRDAAASRGEAARDAAGTFERKNAGPAPIGEATKPSRRGRKSEVSGTT